MWTFVTGLLWLWVYSGFLFIDNFLIFFSRRLLLSSGVLKFIIRCYS